MLKRSRRPRNLLEDAHSFLGGVVPTLGLVADIWSLGMHRHRAIFPKWLNECEISNLSVATCLLFHEL